MINPEDVLRYVEKEIEVIADVMLSGRVRNIEEYRSLAGKVSAFQMMGRYAKEQLKNQLEDDDIE